MKVAFTTKTGEMIDQHFGRQNSFSDLGNGAGGGTVSWKRYHWRTTG